MLTVTVQGPELKLGHQRPHADGLKLVEARNVSLTLRQFDLHTMTTFLGYSQSYRRLFTYGRLFCGLFVDLGLFGLSLYRIIENKGVVDFLRRVRICALEKKSCAQKHNSSDVGARAQKKPLEIIKLVGYTAKKIHRMGRNCET